MGKVPVMGAGYVDEEALQGNTSTDTSSSSSSSASSSAGTSGSGTGTPAATSTGVNTQGVSSMNIDYELLENSRDNLNTVAPEDGEISMISDLADSLTNITKGHDDYLKIWTDGFYVGGGYEADRLKSCNEEFDKYINGLTNTINNNPDKDGGVDAPAESSYGGVGAGSGYGDVGSSPEIDASGVGSQNLDTSVPEFKSTTSEDGLLSSRASDIKPSSVKDRLSSSVIGSSSTDRPGVASAGLSGKSLSGVGGAAAAGGGAIGTAAAAALGDVGGLGAAGSTILNNIDYPSGNYTLSGGFAGRLSDEEKDSVAAILEEYGYTKEEIEAVLNGEFNTSKVLVDRMSKELQDIVKLDPGIRDEIIAKYGFDIYNDSGELDKDKLALALYLDDLNGQDEFSLINMLSKRGVNLVDMQLMGQYSDKLESLLLNNYNIKKLLSDKYGFDLYNLDGSINKDRLILAMLIDDETGTSILDVMNEAASSDIYNALNTSISNLNRPSASESTSGGAGLGTAAVLTAAGAAGAIGYAVHKNNKKKKENEEEEHNQDNSYSDKTIDFDKYEPDLSENEVNESQWVDQAINDAS